MQSWTDYAAKVQQDHKGVLYSFATILPCRGPAFIKETERAIKQCGLKGVFIHSSHKGQYPDDDEARPFWELIQDLDVPVMVHPPHLGFGEERMKEYRLASSIGRPFDLCLALGRLIVRGVLEDFPRLKIVASHGGGGICETISRMDYAYELKDEAFFLGDTVVILGERARIEQADSPERILAEPANERVRAFVDKQSRSLRTERRGGETVVVDASGKIKGVLE